MKNLQNFCKIFLFKPTLEETKFSKLGNITIIQINSTPRILPITLTYLLNLKKFYKVNKKLFKKFNIIHSNEYAGYTLVNEETNDKFIMTIHHVIPSLRSLSIKFILNNYKNVIDSEFFPLYRFLSIKMMKKCKNKITVSDWSLTELKKSNITSNID